MPKLLRVGLLIADTPIDIIVDQYGDYTVMFERILRAAVSDRNATCEEQIDLRLKAFQSASKSEFPDVKQINDFDAFLITGSKHSAYDQTPWILRLKEFVQELVHKHSHIKLVGICFGHQILAEALGGKVTKNPKGWEVGWTQMELSDAGRQYFHTDRAMFALNQMHQDEVSLVPDNFQILASSSVSKCQAMVKDTHCLSVQAHPEFQPGVVKELVKMRSAKGIFTEDQSRQWMSVVDNALDSDWFTLQILEFLLKQ